MITDVLRSENIKKWADDQINSSYSTKLSVGRSKLGGLGLFYDGVLPAPGTCLLRIPRNATLNLDRCLKIMNSGTNKEVKEFIQHCLVYYCSDDKVTETRILICYCVAMLALDRLGKLELLPEAKFVSNYLQILLQTEVANIDFDNHDLLNRYRTTFKGNILFESVISVMESGEAERFASFVKDEPLVKKFAGKNIVITPNDIVHLVSSVNSRTLEIPRSIDGSEDFVTDITLVPILDFANHSIDYQNACFDVDRDTHDIVLNVISSESQPQQHSRHEIFIIYTDADDINRLFFNYGFIPRTPGQWKFIDIPVWGYFQEFSFGNVVNLLKALHQSTNLEFAVRFNDDGQIDDVRLSLLDNCSFLVLLDIPWVKYANKDDPVGKALSALSKEEINRAISQMVKLLYTSMDGFAKNLQEFLDESTRIQHTSGETNHICDFASFQLELASKFRELYRKRVVDTSDDCEKVYRTILDPNQLEASHLRQCRMIPEYNTN